MYPSVLQLCGNRDHTALLRAVLLCRVLSLVIYTSTSTSVLSTIICHQSRYSSTVQYLLYKVNRYTIYLVILATHCSNSWLPLWHTYLHDQQSLSLVLVPVRDLPCIYLTVRAYVNVIATIHAIIWQIYGAISPPELIAHKRGAATVNHSQITTDSVREIGYVRHSNATRSKYSRSNYGVQATYDTSSVLTPEDTFAFFYSFSDQESGGSPGKAKSGPSIACFHGSSGSKFNGLDRSKIIFHGDIKNIMRTHYSTKRGTHCFHHRAHRPGPGGLRADWMERFHQQVPF